MKKFILLFLFILPLTACDESHINENVSLKNEVLKLQEDVRKLQFSTELLEGFVYSSQNTVVFTPSSEGFSKVETAVGDFFVSLEKIEPYADGHKIMFKIGNPYAAKFYDISAKVKYGRSWDGNVSQKDWQDSLKTSEKKLLNEFIPYSWTVLTMTLSPSKSEETGYIALSLDIQGVSLGNIR